MGKTLVVAEKPSVADDYARALGGAFDKHEGYLESDRHVVSWAVGHVVGLADTRAATGRGRALGGVVSLGRVQTRRLALIVSRDAQIDAFEPETYFLVEARFELAGRDARRYRGRWFFEKEERIPDRERA